MTKDIQFTERVEGNGDLPSFLRELANRIEKFRHTTNTTPTVEIAPMDRSSIAILKEDPNFAPPVPGKMHVWRSQYDYIAKITGYRQENT